MSAPGPLVLVTHETVAQSWAKDAGTAVVVIVVVGVGWLLGSVAMQWAGFGLVCLLALMLAGRNRRMTPQAAADLLAERFGVVGRRP